MAYLGMYPDFDAIKNSNKSLRWVEEDIFQIALQTTKSQQSRICISKKILSKQIW